MIPRNFGQNCQFFNKLRTDRDLPRFPRKSRQISDRDIFCHAANSVTHLQQSHQNKPVRGKKADTATVEEISTRAAVCWHFSQELLQLAPVPVDELNTYWYDNFATGEGAVDSGRLC